MKKILVISDTHQDIKSLNDVINLNKDSDYIIHLGDNLSDIQKADLNDIDAKIISVKGNCDFSNFDGTKIEEIEGVRFLITHGDEYRVKNNLNIIKTKALNEQAKVVLFGHTHVPFLNEEDVILFNPGSLNRYRHYSDYPTYGIIEINENKDINIKLMEYIKNGER